MSVIIRIKKRYIIAVILAVFIGITTSVHAEDNDSEGVHTYTAYIYTNGNTGNVTFEVDKNYLIAMYWSEDTQGYQCSALVGKDSVLIGQPAASALFSENYLTNTLDAKNIQLYCENNAAINLRYLTDMEFSENKYIQTNIPIFATREQAEQYVAGLIGPQGALNWEDVLEQEYDSENVPVPRNYEVVQDDSGNYFLQWEQTVEENEIISYPYLQGIINKFMQNGAEFIKQGDVYVYTAEEGTTEIPVEQINVIAEYGILDKKLVYRIDITEDVNKFCTWSRDCLKAIMKAGDDKVDLNKYSGQIVYMLCNVSEVSKTKREYSTVVCTEINVDSSSEKGIQVTVDVSERLTDGLEVSGSIYNDKIYNVSDNSFLGYIINGFGLLGDSGLIGMMKNLFTLLPGDLWSLIGAGIGALIIVAIFKLAIK